MPNWFVSRTLFWFRLWRNGPGIMGKHHSERPYFSEREGYRVFWPKWPAWWRFGFIKSGRADG